jgi:hypothetical protein
MMAVNVPRRGELSACLHNSCALSVGQRREAGGGWVHAAHPPAFSTRPHVKALVSAGDVFGQ